MNIIITVITVIIIMNIIIIIMNINTIVITVIIIVINITIKSTLIIIINNITITKTSAKLLPADFCRSEAKKISLCVIFVDSCKHVRKALPAVERLSGQYQKHLCQSERAPTLLMSPRPVRMVIRLKSTRWSVRRRAHFSRQFSRGTSTARVAKCQIFYTEENLQTKFYPGKKRVNRDKFGI